MHGHLLLEAVHGGGYVNGFKAIPLVLLLLLWTKLLAWADKDAIAAHLPRESLNMGMLGGLVLAYALFFLVPINFFIAILIPLVIFGGEVGTYLMLRKQKVGLGDLSQQFDAWKKGLRKKKQKADPVWQVQLSPKNGAPVPPPPQEDPTRPAFEAAQFALADPMRKGAEQLDMAPAQTGVQVKYDVDGVGYTGPVIDGSTGAAAITYLKGIAGLNLAEVRKPQVGTMKLTIDGQRKEIKVQSAGSTAGEFLRLIVNPNQRHSLTLEQLGMTPQQFSAMKVSVKERKGLVLVAAPKDHGLTSMLYAIIRGHDAYLEHIHTIERDPDQDLEGITQNKLASDATPADEAKQTDWVISQEPHVIMFNKVEDPGTASQIVRFAGTGRAYVGLRAGTAAEAIEQWRKLVADDRLAAENLSLVLVGRVLRKLCAACKESYTPDPNTLRKLNLSPERVTTLFKARETPIRDPKGNPVPCTFCHDLRFKGRTGVFEMVVVDDEMREALKKDFASGGKVGNAFKAAFRKQRGRSLVEEALALVERGETSVQEMLRVVRGGDEAPRSAPAAAAPAGAAPARARRSPA